MMPHQEKRTIDYLTICIDHLTDLKPQPPHTLTRHRDQNLQTSAPRFLCRTEHKQLVRAENFTNTGSNSSVQRHKTRTISPGPETVNRAHDLPVKQRTGPGSTDVGGSGGSVRSGCTLLRLTSELTATRHRCGQQTAQIESTATPSTARPAEPVCYR